MQSEEFVWPGVTNFRTLAMDAASAVLSDALQALHSGFVPEKLPCRLRERTQLLRHVRSCLAGNEGGAVYVAGAPGTGKTATVVRHTGVQVDSRYAVSPPPPPISSLVSSMMFPRWPLTGCVARGETL